MVRMSRNTSLKLITAKNSVSGELRFPTSIAGNREGSWGVGFEIRLQVSVSSVEAAKYGGLELDLAETISTLTQYTLSGKDPESVMSATLNGDASFKDMKVQFKQLSLSYPKGFFEVTSLSPELAQLSGTIIVDGVEITIANASLKRLSSVLCSGMDGFSQLFNY